MAVHGLLPLLLAGILCHASKLFYGRRNSQMFWMIETTASYY